MDWRITVYLSAIIAAVVYGLAVVLPDYQNCTVSGGKFVKTVSVFPKYICVD